MITDDDIRVYRTIIRDGHSLLPSTCAWLLDEIERLRAVLLKYAEEYEGCEAACEALGLEPRQPSYALRSSV